MIGKEQIQKARESPIHNLLGVRNNGRLVQIQCPMPEHRDRSPSFTLYPENTFHCFGCNAHGIGCIDFVMQLTGCSFKEAVEDILDIKE